MLPTGVSVSGRELGFQRIAMVVRRHVAGGRPEFAASAYLLATRLAVSAGHSFENPAGHYEVRLPGQDAKRARVERVVRHRDAKTDLALLVLAEGAVPVPAARWGVLPTSMQPVPFAAVGFPDFAVRQMRPETRQLTGFILPASYLGSPEMELSLSSPPPELRGASPWQGISGAGVVTGDGVVVGVCTSHHRPAGTASLTATGFARMADDPEFERLLADHGVQQQEPGRPRPAPGEGTLQARCMRTHADVVRGLRGRRSYLDEERLPFVDPGLGHASHPDTLFGRLSRDDARGVLLVGPAGSGKTRTCFEVAQRADQAGWLVLHVQADSSVTLEDVAAPVLAAGPRKVLLVLDYLDSCPQLDLPAVDDVLLAEAQRNGVAVVCLASVRPGSLGRVRARGSSRILDEVYVREDWAHQSAVITQVLQQAAPTAVAQWGIDEVARLCGRRPVIALLIARAIEEQGLGRLPLNRIAGVRPGELLGWLQEAMRRDALAASPSASASPLDMASPDIRQLAFTAVVASCPQPRAVVERVVDALLACAGEGDERLSGRQAINTLVSLGWLDEQDGQLLVVHDIVTDELLLRSLMPDPGWSVDEPSATTVFDAMARQPATFAVFAGHLRRVAADVASHGPHHRIVALERYCGEWLADHAKELGALLEHSGREGERALLTMTGSSPWHTWMDQCWDGVVAPWLDRAETAMVARSFLAAALHSGGEVSDPLIGAALGWLERRGQQTDADHVLLALLNQPALAPTVRETVVDRTLAWTGPRPEWRNTADLLKRLIGMDHSPARRENVTRTVLNWLTPYRSEGVGGVLRALLQREDMDAAAREEAVSRGFAWLKRSIGRGSDVSSALWQLLESDGFPDERREELGWLALNWIRTRPASKGTGRVLRALMLADRNSEQLIQQAAPLAKEWTVKEPAVNGNRYVLQAVLDHDGAREAAAVLIDQVACQPHDPSAPTVLQRLLLSRDRLGPEQTRRVVAHALDWLDANDGHPAFVTVLNPVLRETELTAEQLRSAVRLGLAQLSARPDDDPLLATLLSQLEGLTAAQARTVADLGLKRLATHSGKPQRAVLASLLTRTDLTDQQQRTCIDVALRMLDSRKGAKLRPVLCGVLRHPALDGTRRARAVEIALQWLTLHGTLFKGHVVVEYLLGIPDLPANQKKSVIHLARNWLADNPDGLKAQRLRTALEESTPPGW